MQDYAFLAAFNYKHYAPTANIPNELFDIDQDLHRAYHIANDIFKIPKNNITIVTDLPPPSRLDPWEPVATDEKNFRFVRINRKKSPDDTAVLPDEYAPNIEVFIRELVRFMEYTIHTTRSKGECKSRVFFYSTQHGALIPIDRIKTGLSTTEEVDFTVKSSDPDLENALIFSNPYGTNRCYLYNRVIFDILFGQIPIQMTTNSRGQPCGKISVPVVHRFGAWPDVRYEENTFNLLITPPPTTLIDWGVPVTTQVLSTFDTCHSERMANFHYVYDAKTNRMLLSQSAAPVKNYPTCVSLAATRDDKEAPSVKGLGSPFTLQLYTLFSQCPNRVTIKDMAQKINQTLHHLMQDCFPTITSTRSDINTLIPFFTSSRKVIPLKINTPAQRVLQSELKSDVERKDARPGRILRVPAPAVPAVSQSSSSVDVAAITLVSSGDNLYRPVLSDDKHPEPKVESKKHSKVEPKEAKSRHIKMGEGGITQVYENTGPGITRVNNHPDISINPGHYVAPT